MSFMSNSQAAFCSIAVTFVYYL